MEIVKNVDCSAGHHEADPLYLKGAAMMLHQTETTALKADWPIEGTGIPVRLCIHCRCLYAEKND